jgi:hypothetical protein
MNMNRRTVVCVLSGMILLAGCGGQTDRTERELQMPEEKKAMLADYYERMAGTADEQPYFELVLYTQDADHLLLEQYENGRTDRETVKQYTVSKDIYAKVMNLVKTYDLAKWNETGSESAEGVYRVVKYYDSGTYIRVSTDRMPEDGQSAFDAVKQLLTDAIGAAERAE